MSENKKKWRWVSSRLVHAVHERQLAEHGGLNGVRDANAVESALARPQNLAAYGQPDLAALAAAYAFGLARNHGFSDGNKRTAWVTARIFIADNDGKLAFDPADAVRTVEAIASGAMGEDELAEWFRKRLA